MPTPYRLIIGITGASGIIYGIRLLEALHTLTIETHLVVTSAAHRTLQHESDVSITSLEKLANHTYHIRDISAPIASGSFKTAGMIIAPCSMRTLADIAVGTTGNLLTRAADVVLKERKKLVLMTRETPLHFGHLTNMQQITQMGGIIAPPVPAFYTHPKTLEDIVQHSIGRVLDLFDIEHTFIQRWGS